MFSQILIEKSVIDSPRAQSIIKKFPQSEMISIDRWEQVFGSTFRPYLQKRQTPRLIVGQKRGRLVKPAPAAYGVAEGLHYYFVHSYNCIYECEYCYLQGYFKSPDIVVFLNHQEIIDEMQSTLAQHPGQKVWFHAGEFSDSLALSSLTGELDEFWPFFRMNPNANLELRTKSVNLQSLVKLEPLPNVVVSFSMAPAWQIDSLEHKTARYGQRLKAIQKLHQLGFHIGLHFDPIVYRPPFKEDYEKLIQDLAKVFDLSHVAYVSAGVVRFTKDVYQSVTRHYPDSLIHKQNFIRSFDGKVRYNKPFRTHILNQVRDVALNAGVPADRFYLCME